jgi:hypothetical protein
MSEKTLADYLNEAVKNDYLVTALITSYTQAKRKTKNLPFGLGKTTLAFWLSYYLNKQNWDMVFQRVAYNPYDLGKMLQPGSDRKTCVLWDDVQATAPAEQGVPRPIRKLANFLSTERPEVACLIMTAPNMSLISSPIRRLILFEIIVSERGQYEVQKISYHKNFKSPLIDYAKLDYLEETAVEEPFPPLPPEVMARYNAWRIDEKLRLYPSLMSDLERYSRLKEWDAVTEDLSELPVLESNVVRAGRGYAIYLPDELGKRMHNQRLRYRLENREET